MPNWSIEQVKSTLAGQNTPEVSGKTDQESHHDALGDAISNKVAITRQPVELTATNQSKLNFNTPEWKAMVASGSPFSATITIYTTPVSCPRMTRRDKWLKPRRKCVQNYFDYRDKLNSVIKSIPRVPDGIMATFHIAMSTSWSKKKRVEMNGKPHRQKPDGSNLIKAVEDALFSEDCELWRGSFEKRWTTEENERVDIVLIFD